jgi:hypothetical protein
MVGASELDHDVVQPIRDLSAVDQGLQKRAVLLDRVSFTERDQRMRSQAARRTVAGSDISG